MDFSKISDYEFESLAAGVVGELEGVKLSCYAPGADGGIDASNSVAYKTDDERFVLVQAKRYVATPSRRLVDDAKKLAEQLTQDGAHPDVLYLVTSADMSKAKIDKVKAILSECCEYACVLHKRDLEIFLSADENRPILCNHVGLWMPDTAVLQEALHQDSVIDGQMLLDAIETHRGRYHATSMLNRAISICENGGVCLITGPPGIGKTLLSHLVVAHYVKEGYRLSYTTSNDVASVKRSLSTNREVREVCLMDDFLGQRYYQMPESRPTEIASLIRYVQRSRRGDEQTKVIVLNSRLTILNEARRVNDLFRQWLDEHGMDATVVLDASKLTRRDKAGLLCCQLSASGVSAGYIRQMVEGRAYRRIIDNPKFNPRVLERVCKIAAANRVPASRFVDEVSEAMKRPLMVWSDEYENHLQAEDRTLLNVLFSISDSLVDSEILKKCYEARAGSVASIDPTKPSFESCVDRLNDSMLQIVAGPPRRIGVFNPSINDFLQATLEDNPTEVRGLMETSVYSDQMLRLSGLCDDERAHMLVDEALASGSIIEMPWVAIDAGTCYLKLAKSRGWEPCSPDFLARATELCMEESGDYDPIFDMIEDFDYGFVTSAHASEVLPTIVDDTHVRLVLKNWEADKMPVYFDLARQYRHDANNKFAAVFGEWLGRFVDDAMEESAWNHVHEAREEFVDTDEDGNVYIPESAEDECRSLLHSAAKQDALDSLDQLFEGREEILDWLDFNFWEFILGYGSSVDYLDIVMQASDWSSFGHHEERRLDMTDEEIERALNSIANAAQS